MLHSAQIPQDNTFLQMNTMKTAQSALQQFANTINHLLPHAGQVEITPGVTATRRHHTTALTPTIYTPALCLIAQGCKVFYVNKKSLMYDESHVMLFSINMPIVAQIVRATTTTPFLGMRINLQPSLIAEVVQKCFPNGFASLPPPHGAMVHNTSTDIIEAAQRLLALTPQSPSDQHIAPLVLQELLIRLLYSPIGQHLAHIGNQHSDIHRVSMAIDWIHQHFHEPLHIPTLAAITHLSSSAFHAHFKAITGMTPLHYQKSLRLQEAQRLIRTTPLDISEIGFRVGYHSASQFSREYRRMFGVPPSQHKTATLAHHHGAPAHPA